MWQTDECTNLNIYIAAVLFETSVLYGETHLCLHLSLFQKKSSERVTLIFITHDAWTAFVKKQEQLHSDLNLKGPKCFTTCQHMAFPLPYAQKMHI